MSYFTDTHREYIDDYVDDVYTDIVRERVYSLHLYPVIDKIIHGVIYKHRMFNTQSTIDDLKASTHLHIYEMLEASRTTDKYYDKSKGDSFSYITRSAQNFIFQRIRDDARNKDVIINESELNYQDVDGTKGEIENKLENLATYEDKELDLNDSTIYERLKHFIINSEDRYFKIYTDKEIAYSIIDVIENTEVDQHDEDYIKINIIQRYSFPEDYVNMRFNKVFDRTSVLYKSYMAHQRIHGYVPTSTELKVLQLQP